MNAAAPTDDKPWYRHYWVWIVILPPFAAVVAGLWTVYLSIQNAPTLVVDDYRTIGLASQRDIERDQRAAELGLHAVLQANADEVVVELDIVNEIVGMPESLRVFFFHPTIGDKDRIAELVHQQGARFVGHNPGLAADNYYFEIRPRSDLWRLVGRLSPGDAAGNAGADAGKPKRQ